MKKYRKIAEKNLPFRSPLIPIATLWLLLDRLDAHPYLIGAFWLLAVFMLSAWILELFNKEEVNLLEKE